MGKILRSIILTNKSFEIHIWFASNILLKRFFLNQSSGGELNDMEIPQ